MILILYTYVLYYTVYLYTIKLHVILAQYATGHFDLSITIDDINIYVWSQHRPMFSTTTFRCARYKNSNRHENNRDTF